MTEYFYCDICHQNDPRGKKHIFKKAHKQNLKRRLEKFLEKVGDAHRAISDPVVTALPVTDIESKFWCLFCLQEIKKHKTIEDVVVHYGVWVEHLCSCQHSKNVHKFFWANKLDHQKKEKYKLSFEDYQAYTTKSEEACRKHQKEREDIIKQDAAKIRAVEQQRALVISMSQVPNEDETSSSHSKMEASNHSFTSNHSQSCVAFRQGPPSQGMSDDQVTSIRSQYEEDQMNGLRIFTSIEEEHADPFTKPQGDNSDEVGTGSHNITGVSSPGREYSNLCLCNSGSSQAQHSHSNSSSQGQLVDKGGPSYKTNDTKSAKSNRSTRKLGAVEVKSSGGLTCIGLHSSKRGNIFSGALPPWMLDEDEDDDETDPSQIETAPIIGPSEEDFKKYLELQAKKKLNPNRVGANFDHSASTSSDWLPSFGRVWNHGPRWHSRKQYRGEIKNLKKKSSPTKPP